MTRRFEGTSQSPDSSSPSLDWDYSADLAALSDPLNRVNLFSVNISLTSSTTDQTQAQQKAQISPRFEIKKKDESYLPAG